MKIYACNLSALAIACAGTLASAIAFADAGHISTDTDLKSAPRADAATVATLSVNTAIDVSERNGAWYAVKSAQGKGWVRMLNVRLGTGARTQGDTTLGGLAALGKASRTETTVATGVRGLSKENLQSARENPRELAKLDQYEISEEAALAFGAAEHLPAPR